MWLDVADDHDDPGVAIAGRPGIKLDGLVDDVLDVTGTAEQLGKPIGSDSENGKTTFVTLFGVDGAMQLAEKLNDETCTALRDAFGEKSAFLEQLARTLLNRRS